MVELGCLPGDDSVTGVFWDKAGCFQVREPGMKAFGQYPALLGWGTGWGRVPPSPRLPPSRELQGLPGPRGRFFVLVRGCSGPISECPHHRLAQWRVSQLCQLH